jgi:DNA-binding MarR family transcriptional regulator
MELTDQEETVLRVFLDMETDTISNDQLREIAGLDEFAFFEIIGVLEKQGFVERYVGQTVLLTKGRIYIRRMKTPLE